MRLHEMTQKQRMAAVRRQQDREELMHLIGDCIAGVCVFLLPFVLLWLAAGLGY